MKHRAGDHLWGPMAGTRATTWAAVVAAVIGASACGGGDSSGAPPSSGGNPPPAGPGPAGAPAGGTGAASTGTLRVKISDVFGDVVAGASVWVSSGDTTLTTGSDGVVQFDNVPAGQTRVCARHWVRGHICIAPDPVTVEKDKLLELFGRLQPVRGPAAAVLGTSVDPGGIGADGRTVDVTIRVAVPADVRRGSYFGEDSFYQLAAVDCSARSGDELAQLGSRCIRAVDGRDISYGFAGVNDRGSLKATDRAPQATVLGLLIEQSDAGLSSNWMPNEPRLFAAKLFADELLPDTRLALAAFASDEASGRASSLARRPVTFFPVESPGFTTSRSQAFGVLHDLSSLVGGGAPLYEAIAAGIDFMAANAPDGTKRVLVVLADGSDSTCGTLAQCAEWRRKIVSRARETGVDLFLVGARGEAPWEWEEKYWSQGFYLAKESLSDLASEGGIPLAVGVSLRNEFGFSETADFHAPLELVRHWLATSEQVQDVRVRLASDTEGAFAPGAIIKGQLLGQNPSECPWYCYTYVLPFNVEIPR